MSSLLKRLVQLVLLVVAVLLIRHYVFSPAAVNGSSMEPTLHNNDRLWVTSIKKPQRFDIIAFPSPRNGQRVVYLAKQSSIAMIPFILMVYHSVKIT